MARVRYARSLRDLEAADGARRTADEGGVRLVRCRYETDPEAVAAVVPRPLEAAPACEVEVLLGAPLAGEASTAGAPLAGEASTAGASLEGETPAAGALIGVRVDYDGAAGLMPLVVPCADPAAVVAGRERFGEPRKRADVDVRVSGEDVSAEIARRGVSFLRLSGRFDGALAPAEWSGASFSFKAFPAADPGKSFDHDPQLVRSDWRFVSRSARRLAGGLELWDSPFDPIADLPVRRLVGLEYAEGRWTRAARVLRPVPGDWLRPFLHQRDDAPGTEGVDV